MRVHPRLSEQYKFVKEPITGTALWLFLILSLLVGFSYYWNVDNLYKEKVTLATESARANWNKDQAFRGWATRHGGVYVKPDSRTPPNPYLAHIPKRDVITADGTKLTLMNPAYMMSQMTREYEDTYGIKGRITGRTLLNPANKADKWELMALDQFDKGVREFVAQASINGEPYVRYMKPMIMQQGCMMCHGHLGFKVGDIRGGVSVSIPLTPYFAAADITRHSMLITHILVWFTGAIALGMYTVTANRREKIRHYLQQQLNQQNRILVEAHDAAQKSSNAKSEFLSRMSHELRTPLNAILGFGQLLEMNSDNLTRLQKENIGDIITAGNHLLALVNEVLDLSRIDSGKMEINLQETELAPLIEQCTNLIQVKALSRNIRINNKLVDTSYRILADTNRFKQVLLNLLTNAVKYNRHSGQVTIDGTVTASNRIRISITDTGNGLTDEQIDRLFVSFERLDQDDSEEGTGIGLVIARHLVELMGGTIDVSSTPGTGSVFSFELPLAGTHEDIQPETCFLPQKAANH